MLGAARFIRRVRKATEEDGDMTNKISIGSVSLATLAAIAVASVFMVGAGQAQEPEGTTVDGVRLPASVDGYNVLGALTPADDACLAEQDLNIVYLEAAENPRRAAEEGRDLHSPAVAALQQLGLRADSGGNVSVVLIYGSSVAEEVQAALARPAGHRWDGRRDSVDQCHPLGLVSSVSTTSNALMSSASFNHEIGCGCVLIIARNDVVSNGATDVFGQTVDFTAPTVGNNQDYRSVFANQGIVSADGETWEGSVQVGFVFEDGSGWAFWAGINTTNNVRLPFSPGHNMIVSEDYLISSMHQANNKWIECVEVKDTGATFCAFPTEGGDRLSSGDDLPGWGGDGHPFSESEPEQQLV